LCKLTIPQKDHKAYQRGEVRKEIRELLCHKIINLDGEGIPAIGRVGRTPSRTSNPTKGTSKRSVVKRESIDSEFLPGIKCSEQGIKQELVSLDEFASSNELAHAAKQYDLTGDDEPSAKRVKIEKGKETHI
jgi:hypothetical protein